MKSQNRNGSPYQMINISTGALIVLIFAYSAIFGAGGDSYPVECTHVSLLGKECPTCGLSRSFTEMTRGNISEARELNVNGPLLFGFFASQLLLRVLAGSVLMSINKGDVPALQERRVSNLVMADAVLSVLLFLVSFRFLLVFW